MLTDPDGGSFDINPFAWAAPFTAQGGGLIPEIIKGAAGALAGEAVEQLVQTPQYGVTVTPGASCWDTSKGKLSRRARVKLQRMPDGGIQVVRYCAPKRMNPLNPRALSRAARRLGSFQRIAAHIEKTIQKACKAKPRRSRVSYGAGCAPKRCR